MGRAGDCRKEGQFRGPGCLANAVRMTAASASALIASRDEHAAKREAIGFNGLSGEAGNLVRSGGGSWDV